MPVISPDAPTPSPSQLKTPDFTNKENNSFRQFFSGDKATDNMDPTQLEREEIKHALDKEVRRYSKF